MINDIMLITNFWHFNCEKSSSRYSSLAEILTNNGYSLEVVTSDFYHRTKEKRKFDKKFFSSFPYKISLLSEPVYKKNVSIKRLRAHKKFAKNVEDYLKKRKKPDAIIVVIPSTYVAKYVVRFCNRNKIPVILDIQDLWPEAFQMAFNVPILSEVLFYPLKRMAEYAYKNADSIVAVSETYARRGAELCKKSHSGTAIYLGANYDYAKSAIESIQIDKTEDEFWITYIGALGYSYNIKLVIDAVSILQDRGVHNIQFHVFGNGVLEDEFKTYAKRKSVKTKFFGHTEYGVMMAYLANSDVAVNPISGKSVASIINKVCDYATAGVPVINDQNSTEYRNMLRDYNCGINCRNNNAQDFANAIFELYNDKELRQIMRRNAIQMASEKFDRNKTYLEFVKILRSFEN